jgi:hypothetical protein
MRKWRSLRAWRLAVLASLSLFLANMPNAPAETGSVDIYFFWGDGCPHCAKASLFLYELAARNDAIELHSYEVWYDPANASLFARMTGVLGFEPYGVPTIIIGNRYWVGYADSFAKEIGTAAIACIESGCPDAGVGVIPGAAGEVASADGTSPARAIGILDLPLIGSVDLTGQSLTINTALIALVDGFNPCSLWVISILLALALHTGSRRKVLFIGLIFITVAAAVYALFIAGLFTMLSIVNVVGWIQIAVALIALLFGFINIKDYFFFRMGPSLTIAEHRKPGIYQHIRRVVTAGESFRALAAATVVLAAGVSLIEFSCTAGFPVLWTNLLVSQDVTASAFVLLLLLYLVIYQLDELAIFLAAVFTLRASRIGEKQGRMLKLAGGMLMLALAGAMLVDPALMNRLDNSLVVFGIAVAATGLVLLLHRQILPRFGIHIGDDAVLRQRNRPGI